MTFERDAATSTSVVSIRAPDNMAKTGKSYEIAALATYTEYLTCAYLRLGVFTLDDDTSHDNDYNMKIVLVVC